MRKLLPFLLGIICLPVAWAERPVPKMPLPTDSPVPHDRLAIGINYTGAQVRLGLSSRWALEGRYQQGTATSNYGDVTARVFGLRAYRFIHPEHRLPFYWGLEGAYASAKPATSYYETSGAAIGAFGGVECRIARWLSIDMDLGPYVISLKEKHTHTGSTNLDFVANTAILVRIF